MCMCVKKCNLQTILRIPFKNLVIQMVLRLLVSSYHFPKRHSSINKNRSFLGVEDKQVSSSKTPC